MQLRLLLLVLLVSQFLSGFSCSKPTSPAASQKGRNDPDIPRIKHPTAPAVPKTYSSILANIENVTVDGVAMTGGSEREVESGKHLISFRKTDFLPLIIDPVKNQQDEGNSTLNFIKFLGCVSLLPICVLSRNGIFEPSYTAETGQKQTKQKVTCTASAELTLEANQAYVVDIKVSEKKSMMVVNNYTASDPVDYEYEINCTEDNS